MTDEIRPVRIHRPRRVRPASREENEEPDEEERGFKGKLAELTEGEEERPRGSGSPPVQDSTGREDTEAEEEPGPDEEDLADGKSPAVGRNLDVTT